VYLKSGTSIASGGSLAITIPDNDGLSNRWEMEYFENLDQNPDDDYDGDGLTNALEYQLGTDPTFSSSDHDGDGLDDVWEATYFGDLSHDCDTDANEDGVYDCVEFKFGRDPNASNSKGPGIYYSYDELGRIQTIERIPEK
jgi:hypothetical protein